MRYDKIRSDVTFIKIILFIQRALKSGRSNQREMGAVSKYITYIIKNNASACIRSIESILYNNKGKMIKVYMNKLYVLINELLNININYERLITKSGNIDNNKLNLFIDIDNDLLDLLKDLRVTLEEIKSNGFKKSKERLLKDIINSIERNISQRSLIN